MEEDLTFVDPERRAEVRRRLAAVKRFLEEPGRANAVRLAGEIGLGPGQFYRLVRAWQLAGRPEDLAHAVRRRSRRSTTFDDGERQAIRDLETAGLDASVERVVIAVQERAGRDGLRRHGRSATRKLVAELRRERLAGTAAGVGLAVDHCAMDLPVTHGHGSTTMPIATLVVDLEGRVPIGLALSADGPSPAGVARALLHALDAPFGGPRPVNPVPISLDVDGDAAWSGLIRMLEEGGLVAAAKSVEVIRTAPSTTAMLGASLLGVPLRPRHTARPADLRRPTGSTSRRVKAAPVGAELAEAMLRSRLALRRGSGSVLDALGSEPRARLSRLLQDLPAASTGPSG